MSEATTETFPSDRLDEMSLGTIELSVPLLDGIIQIGAGGEADVGRIRVTKESCTVTVVRVDGGPIQVDIVADAQSSTRVFEAAVPALRLVRLETRWLVAENAVAAERLSDVKRFADVVGTFAAAKQGRAQHSHRG
ncbi:hypothetical protein [Mycobacterium sp. AT1]|uniref:hypothetical protein n=1 Tax=Mycobacterium sp. AT1 TaxID=1961706 RepID=UPI0011514B10|nr:hypothetical protein [Mycobacterium sp. AT1]